MPELPEVETVRRTIAPHLTGQTIVDIWRSPLALRREKPNPRLLTAALHRARIDEVIRAGKYLLLKTAAGGALVHLGMSGRLTVEDPRAALMAHTHVRLSLDGGRELRLVDPRRFGLFRPFVGNALPDEWSALGLDPLSKSFTPPALRDALQRTTRAVKLALLDQSVVAGLGNIYVSEALYLARIHPARSGRQISAPQSERLTAAIVDVLTQGIANRGTSLSDYVDGEGLSGSNQDFLKVYGRQGLPCGRCGGAVKMAVMGARSTFYCPACQPRRSSA